MILLRFYAQEHENPCQALLVSAAFHSQVGEHANPKGTQQFCPEWIYILTYAQEVSF